MSILISPEKLNEIQFQQATQPSTQHAQHEKRGHHKHASKMHEHAIIEPASTGTTSLNPGAIHIGR